LLMALPARDLAPSEPLLDDLQASTQSNLAGDRSSLC
jgi:hypothetical protein